jgi:uncharacterized protein (DUF1684 family)
MEARPGNGGLWYRIAIGLIAASFLFSSCSEPRQPNPAPADPILKDRQERDAFFRADPRSPIPEKERAYFKGLDYFPIHEGYRFHVPLHRYQVPERMKLATNTGELREGLKYGYFEFPLDGKICRLQVYRMEDSSDTGKPYLFIPFRDATTGVETYAAGRYLDLNENTTGFYDLDFNRAYNPYCAYNTGYSCPIPPEENRLAVPIRAGEKNYNAPHLP